MQTDSFEGRLYPWGGEFVIGNPCSPVAVCIMGESIRLDLSQVAIYGPLKTENLGIEKIVANIVSNRFIRHLVIWGEEIIGHRSGQSLLSLWKNGIGDDARIKGANGAVPFIENLDQKAISHFQKQVQIVDLLGINDQRALLEAIRECLEKRTGPFPESYEAIKIENRDSKGIVSMSDTYALHKDMRISLYCEIMKAGI